ncbi:hypothetical protein [Frigoribacterium sp. MEB024]|uniref:hypothetical protein n=1 Tax=Frigoribacterium sp. MEB024 TaxID=1589899 RepID=UPI0012DFED7C|nr:hypothetical protein [Frigoribacterium sp. MEB024]
MYDVGASPDVSLLGSAIGEFVYEMTSASLLTLDFVVISHVDEDHVNRLPALISALKRANISVGTLVLPWLGGASKLLGLMRLRDKDTTAIAAQLLQSDSAVTQFAASLGFRDVTFVKASSGTIDDSPAPDPIPDGTGANHVPVPARVVDSGTDVAPAHAPWEMLVAQLAVPAAILDGLAAEITKATGLDVENEADRRKLVDTSKTRAQLREILEVLGRTHDLARPGVTLTNWSSISLHSTSTNPYARHTVPEASALSFSVNCEHAWLHTGDLPLHLDDVWQEFESEWDRIGVAHEVCTVTAPHHGSQHGHNINLYTRFVTSAVVFTFGLTVGTQRGVPKWSKLLDPKPVMRHLRLHGALKLRLLNNRP